MKINKRMSIVLTGICVVLSAFAIKGQTFTIGDLDKTTKENAGFSVMPAIQQTFNLTTPAMFDYEAFCRNKVSSFSPQGDQGLSSFGGTFKGKITWSDFDYWEYCGLIGPIIFRETTVGWTTEGVPQLRHRFPGEEEATFSLGPNTGLLSRTVPFKVGGKEMQIVQRGQISDFSFINWVQGRIREQERRRCVEFDPSKCPNPKRNVAMGIRG